MRARHLVHHRARLRAVFPEELSRGSNHLDGLPRERRGVALGGGDEPHRRSLPVRVRLRRGVRLLRHLAFPPRVAVDVRAENPPEPFRALAPLRAALGRLGARREGRFPESFDLASRDGELSLHVHLMRAVSHQDVLLVAHREQALGHLLQASVRLGAFLLKRRDVRLGRAEFRLGEVATLGFLLGDARVVARLRESSTKLATLVFVRLELLLPVAKPVALSLRRARALFQRRHLLRRRRRLLDAIQRLFLDVVELPRHLLIPRRRLFALALALLARLIEHALHLRQRLRVSGVSDAARVEHRARGVRERRRKRSARVAERGAKRRHLGVSGRELLRRGSKRRRRRRALLPALTVARVQTRARVVQVTPKGFALGARALELLRGTPASRRLRRESTILRRERLDLALLRVAGLGQQLVVILRHASILRQRFG